jgi:hypothetical protein
MLDAQQARGFETIVHAQDVQPQRDVRGMSAADQVGKIDDALRLGGGHGGHHVVELREVSPDRGDLRAEIGKGMRTRVDVHTRDGMPARGQQADQAIPDESGTPDHEDAHGSPQSTLRSREAGGGSLCSRPLWSLAGRADVRS